MSAEPENSPATDPVVDKAAAKELRKKQKLEEQAKEARKLALQKAKANQRKAASTVATDKDDEADDVPMTDAEKAIMEELKALPNNGRSVDSIAQPDGLTRRMTIAEMDMLSWLSAGKSDEEKATLLTSFNDKAFYTQTLESHKTSLIEAQKKKAYKGKSGASLEAKIANTQRKARKLIQNLVKQFVVLSVSAEAVIANFNEALTYINIGLFDIDHADDSTQETFLHQACRAGVVSVVSWLLQQGANPNSHNSKGETPTHILLAQIAAAPDNVSDHYKCLWHVLERGADLTAKDIQSRSCYDVAAAMDPPFEINAIMNILTLAHSKLTDFASIFTYVSTDKSLTQAEFTAPLPMGQIIKLGLKEYKMKKLKEAARLKEEEDRLQLEKEMESQAAAEQAMKEKQEALQHKKRSKILMNTILEYARNMTIYCARSTPDYLEGLDVAALAALDQDDSYDDHSNSYAFVKFLCDPNLTSLFHNHFIDLDKDVPFAPVSLLFLAVMCRKPMLVEALLACDCEVNITPTTLTSTASIPSETTTPLATALILLNSLATASNMEANKPSETEAPLISMCEKLVEAGAFPSYEAPTLAPEENADTKTHVKRVCGDRVPGGEKAVALLTHGVLQPWFQNIWKATDVSLYNESKKRRLLAGLLVLMETMEEHEKAAIAEAQEKIKERKKRAKELAQKKKEMTESLLTAAQENQELLKQQIDTVNQQLSEQQLRAQQEEAEAEAALADRLARGRKDVQEDLYEKAMKLAALQAAQSEADAAKAEAELQAKLAKGKKPKTEKTKLTAEGEELLRQQQIEKEELMEEFEPPGLMDNVIDSMFSILDFTYGVPTDEQVAVIKPEITSFTVRAMDRSIHDFKFFKKSYNGIDVHILNNLIEKGYNPTSGEGAWEAAKSLDELINASIAERKILKKLEIQPTNFSKRTFREIKRRTALLDVNAYIYEDLLRRVMQLHKKTVMKQAKEASALPDYQAIQANIAAREEVRAELENAELMAKFNPPINTVKSGTLSKALVLGAAPNLVSMDTAFQSVHPDDQDDLLLDLHINAKLEGDLPLWDVLGYATRQLANTDAIIRETRDEKMKIQEQLDHPADGAVLDESQKTLLTDMLQRLNDKMYPLDSQRDMYTKVISAIGDHEQKEYAKLNPEDQLMWNKLRDAHNDKVTAAMLEQENARLKLKSDASKPSKSDMLLQKVMQAHKQDWDKKDDTFKPIVTSDGRVEDVDDTDLDTNWLMSRLGDLTGIDRDIINDLELLTEDQAVRYLAVNMAENEADGAFLRKCHKATVDTFNPEEKSKFKEYENFIDRRFPMYQHLYKVLSGFLDPVDQGLDPKFVPFDGVSKTVPHKFKHSDQDLVDLNIERDVTKDLLFAKHMLDATLAPYDWSDLREAMAADTFVDSLTKVGATLDMDVLDKNNNVNLGVLISLHRSLHAQCQVSEDTVQMIVNTTGAGRCNATNLVKVLHGLHVACCRDSSVLWDSRVIYPGSVHMPFTNTYDDAHKLGYGTNFGLMTGSQAELVFGFNDADVKSDFYAKFLRSLLLLTDKQNKVKPLTFPIELFSRKNLSLNKAVVLPEVAELTRSMIPIESISISKQDSFMTVPTLPTVEGEPEDDLKYKGPERLARLGVGFGDLRHHLVAEPDLSQYLPRGWNY